MAELSAAMQTALAGSNVLLFGMVEISLPGYDLCLLDGSGVVNFAGKTFVGADPTYGVLDTIKGLNDQLGAAAPRVTLGLIPASEAALAALVDPAVQGSAVTISVGVINPATGQPLPSPYAVFLGELDVPTIKWGKNNRRLEYTVTSVAERLFQIEEGRRLSDAFHQKVWPGESGLYYCTDVEIILAWGQKYDGTAVYTRSNLPGYAETFNRT